MTSLQQIQLALDTKVCERILQQIGEAIKNRDVDTLQRQVHYLRTKTAELVALADNIHNDPAWMNGGTGVENTPMSPSKEEDDG